MAAFIQFFATNAGLHPDTKGSAFSKAPLIRFMWESVSELNYSSLALQPADLLAPLTDQTQLSLSLRELLLPGFHQNGHPCLTLDMTTVATG